MICRGLALHDACWVRQHDRGHLDRLAVLIAQRELAFGVRAQGRLGARISAPRPDGAGSRGHTGSAPACSSGVSQRGIAEHDALVARPVPVHALGDMGRLFVQVVVDLAACPSGTSPVHSRCPDAVADDAVDAAHHRLRSPLSTTGRPRRRPPRGSWWQRFRRRRGHSVLRSGRHRGRHPRCGRRPCRDGPPRRIRR